MSEPDELFTLRSLFYIGNYQGAINEATGLSKLRGALAEEKDELVYRCYLAMGQYNIVLGEINENANVPVGKKALKLMAKFLEDPSNGDLVLLQLNEWLSDLSASGSKTLQTITATIYTLTDNINEAFRILGEGSSAEQMAMLIQLYLKINRLDLAQNVLKKLKAVDEDSALTMMATAWTLIYTSPAKAQDAVYVYEELVDKYGGTAPLLNGLAAAKMHLGLFDEAEVALKEALTKSPSDPDSLANLIAASYHLGRSQEVINRYLSQLKSKNPKHDLVVSIDTFEKSFDRVASSLV